MIEVVVWVKQEIENDGNNERLDPVHRLRPGAVTAAVVVDVAAAAAAAGGWKTLDRRRVERPSNHSYRGLKILPSARHFHRGPYGDSDCTLVPRDDGRTWSMPGFDEGSLRGREKTEMADKGSSRRLLLVLGAHWMLGS